MGCNSSKKLQGKPQAIKEMKEINYDFKNVKIPSDFELLKIVSYNVDIINSINIRTTIGLITEYIFSNNKNKQNDIICLQGIRDKIAMTLLVKFIKSYSKKSKIDIYIVPDLNIELDNEFESPLHNSFGASWGDTDNYEDELETKNIIISKYKILSHFNSKLSDDINLIGANILIKNKIISVYTSGLTEDIGDINNNNKRNEEINEIPNIIDNNIKEIQNLKEGTLSNIHFFCVCLNIPEIENLKLSSLFINITKNNKYVDIYRLKNKLVNGNTNKQNIRIDYIFLVLTENIEKPNSQKQLLESIFKKYRIHFIKNNVRNDITDSNHYPIECICMIQTD